MFCILLTTTLTRLLMCVFRRVYDVDSGGWVLQRSATVVWVRAKSRFRSKLEHLPEIELVTGERKQIESVVILECSSEYYSSEDPQSYDPLRTL